MFAAPEPKDNDMSTPARAGLGDLSRIAVFAAIIAVLGLISIGGAVPITGQTLGVMLAGAVLGAWRGLAAVGTLLALAAVGLPVLAGGRGGLQVFFGPTGGYILGWLVGVVVIGLIVRLGASRPVWWRTAIACLVGGVGVVYLFGIPVMSLNLGIGLGEAAVSSLLFLPGDLIKVVLATIVTMGLWRAYPRAFRWSTTARSADRADDRVVTERG